MTKRGSNEIFFSLNDFKILFKKNKASYLKIGSVCFMCVFIGVVTKNPSFKAEATFKQSSQSQDSSSPLKNLFSSLSSTSSYCNVVTTMKSRVFLKEIVSDLGMQVSVKETGFLTKKFINFKDNLQGEMKKKIAHSDGISFTHVKYDGDQALDFKLKIKLDGNFEVLDKKGSLLALSHVGALVTIDEASFIIKNISNKMIPNKIYPLKILPWEEVVIGVQRKFYIKEDKKDNEVLQLSFISKNQELASNFLNDIMKKYSSYVKKENEDLTQEQITFLEERKKELEDSYGLFLQEHATYLESSLEKEGFLGLKQEMEVLEKPNEDYHTKLYDVELELNRLRPSASLGSKNENRSLLEDNNKRKKSKYLESQERSSLKLQEKLGAYLSSKFSDKDNSQSEIISFANSLLQDDIKQLAECKDNAIAILQTLEKKNAFIDSSHIQFAPDSLLTDWIAQIRADEKMLLNSEVERRDPLIKKLEDKKDKLKEFLNIFLLAIEKRQNTLLDQEIEEGFSSIELEGLNPETAQQLYLEYNHELDAVKLNIKQLIYLKGQIYDPNVELSSLCNLLTDPVSQHMIEKAGQMSLDLRDDFNRSSKEHERLKDSLTTQKIFLKNHITQMIEIQRMRAKLIEEKILSLQQSSVNLLCTEKNLIQDRLAELRKKMSTSLPKKWKMENQIQLKKELYKSMIEGISQLEESKRVDQNIIPSRCKIVDTALVPKKIQPPGLFLYPILLSFLLMISKYGYDFFRRVSRGSPISFELLKHYDFHACGSISSYSHAPIGEINAPDLETLRRLAHFASLQKKSSEGLSLALLGHSQSNYSHNLSKILSQRGYKVLLIDSTFHGLSSGQSSTGLLAYLRGEVDSPATHPENGYNFIYSGGYSRNFIELLSHKKFTDFILASKKDYDFVVSHSEASSSSLEATIYQSISDVCAVSAGFEDSLEDLENFIEWKESQNRDCLTFVLRES